MRFQISKPYPINQVLSGLSASVILPPAAPLSTAYLDCSPETRAFADRVHEAAELWLL